MPGSGLGDDATRFERLSISVALAGYGAWFVMLVAAAVGIAYGAPTAVASTAAAVGTMFVGFALLTVDDTRVGALVAIAAVGLLVPYTIGWLVFGLGWVAAGVAMFEDPGEGVACRRSRSVLTPATGRLYRQPIQ